MALDWLGFDHCSVIVTDAARSRAFYGGVLGLEEIAPPKTFDFLVLWFRVGGGQCVHLLLKPQPDTRSPRHFCLQVPDAQAARAHFRQHGVAIEETTPIPGADRFFVCDPDGNRIEILHWQRAYRPEEDGRFQV